jgi:hypothetical protein
MITYEVTFSGWAKGYQVIVDSPKFEQAELVGNFSSLEAFAEDMREIDALPGHTDVA